MTFVMAWTASSPPQPQESCIEGLIPSTSELGNRVFTEVVKVTWGRWGRPQSYRTGVLTIRGNVGTEIDTGTEEMRWRNREKQVSEILPQAQENQTFPADPWNVSCSPEKRPTPPTPWTRMPGLQSWERIMSMWKAPSLGVVLTAAPGSTRSIEVTRYPQSKTNTTRLHTFCKN